MDEFIKAPRSLKRGNYLDSNVNTHNIQHNEIDSHEFVAESSQAIWTEFIRDLQN